MTKLSLFFVFAGFFLSLLTYGQTEGQLRQELQATKNKTTQLQIRLRLLDAIYERNRNEWQKEIDLLILQRKAYDGANNQALISLVEAERALYFGNDQKLKNIFNQKLANFTFKDDKFNRRKNLLGCRISSDPQYHYRNLIKASNGRLKHREQAALYLQIAKNFCATYQKDSAIWASNIALQHAKRADKKWVLIDAMQQQAEVFWHFNLLEQAVQRSIYSLQLAEEAEFSYFKINPLLLIASISIEVKNLSQAITYTNLAQDLAKINKDERAMAYAHYLMSRYYTETDLPDKAGTAANLAFRFFRDNGNQSYANRAMLLMISSSERSGIKSVYSYANLLSKNDVSNDIYFASELYFEYGQYLLALNKVAAAKSALEKSLSFIPTESLIRPKIANTYRILASIFAQTGQQDSAYKYQQKYSFWLENNPAWRSAARIEEMAAANLREERERLIINQQASIERAKKVQEIIKLQRDRQLYISIIFIVAIIFGVVVFVLRTQQIKIKQEQKEAELSQTLLRTQMNPHFVFNAMSVIQSYIYENDPEKSSQFLVNFSRLMRLILENSPKEFIPIELEREILDKYLTAQKMRFENRFDYELTVSDNLLFNKAMVSPMITQPFIENAIEHGQLHTIQAGKIWVNFKDDGDKLLIQIQDNGVGRKKSADTKKLRTHKSMAIDITRERIEILNKKYKFNGSLTISDLDVNTNSGTNVTLVLPLKYETEQ